MDGRRIFVIAESWNSFEIFLLVACILSGVSGIIAPEKSSSAVQEVLSNKTIQLIWYIGLIVGGLIGLYGVVRNIFIERIGLTVLMGISFGYSLIIFHSSSRTLTQASFMTLAFSVACVLRILQINRHLKR